MKVPGGKLIRVRGMVSEGRISEIVITGDFFLHPEERIEELEASLRGVPLERSAVAEVVESVLKDAEMVGASPEDLVEVIMRISR